MVVGDKGSKGTAPVVFRHERRSAFRNNEEGWIPGQDISGIVLRQAADGSGPPAGARIVALMDELGWAERAAVPTQRIAVLPDTVSFAAAAGRRPHRVAHVTARRTVARKARADHRRGRRGWSPRSAARCAFRCARHRGSGTAGAAGLRELGSTDVVVGIEQAQGRFRRERAQQTAYSSGLVLPPGWLSNGARILARASACFLSMPLYRKTHNK